jgi:hypothetical protein
MARPTKMKPIEVGCACCGYQGEAVPRDGTVVAARTRTRQCEVIPDVWICTICMINIEDRRRSLADPFVIDLSVEEVRAA